MVASLLHHWVIFSSVICCWSATAFFAFRRLAHSFSTSQNNIDIKSLFEGDVVIVSDAKQMVSLAAVTSSRTLQPLCLRVTSGIDELEAGGKEIILYEDEEREPLAVTDVILGEVIDDVIFTQRCVEDRISNPHGEHAEDVWLVANPDIITSISTATIFLPLRSGH